MNRCFGILTLAVAVAACTSPAQKARQVEAERAAQEDKARAPQDRQEVLATLKSYKAGQTTLLQYYRDSGHDVSEGIGLFTPSRVWKEFQTKIRSGPNGLQTATIVVGYSGGPLATLNFEKGVLSSIVFM
jgi:hypothetical protein